MWIRFLKTFRKIILKQQWNNSTNKEIKDKEIVNTDYIVVQSIPPTFTLFKLLPSEGSTNLKLQSSSQVFTIGFLALMGSTILQVYLFSTWKLSTQPYLKNEVLEYLT